MAEPLMVSGAFFPKEQMQTRLWQTYQTRLSCGPLTPDSSYVSVNPAWLPYFYQRWKDYLKQRGVPNYSNGFDCNKFAASFAAFAQIEFFAAKRRGIIPTASQAQALAIAEAWVRFDDGSGHAVNLICLPDKAAFYEPQTGEFISLTDDELRSFTWIRF